MLATNPVRKSIMNMGRSACTFLAVVLALVLAVPQSLGQCQWRLEGSIDTSTETVPQEVVYDGQYVYALTSEPTLEIYDVSDPAAIRLLSRFTPHQT